MYSKEVKSFVKRLLEKLRYEAKRGTTEVSVRKPIERAAFLTGIARSTLYRIDKDKLNDASSPAQKSQRKKKLDNFDLDVIERAIKAMFKNRICITLNKLKANLRDNFDITVSTATLWKAVRSKGMYIYRLTLTWCVIF